MKKSLLSILLLVSSSVLANPTYPIQNGNYKNQKGKVFLISTNSVTGELLITDASRKISYEVDYIDNGKASSKFIDVLKKRKVVGLENFSYYLKPSADNFHELTVASDVSIYGKNMNVVSSGFVYVGENSIAFTLNGHNLAKVANDFEEGVNLVLSLMTKYGFLSFSEVLEKI